MENITTQDKLRLPFVLERPLLALDLIIDHEMCRVLSITAIRMQTNGDEHRYHSLCKPERFPDRRTLQRYNIDYDQLRNAPYMTGVFKTFQPWLNDADIFGFGISADWKILEANFELCQVSIPQVSKRRFIDPKTIYQHREYPTLSNVYKSYHFAVPPRENAFSNIHAAGEILEAQTSKYNINPHTKALEKESKGPYMDFDKIISISPSTGIPVLSEGEHKGKKAISVAATDPTYFRNVLKTENLHPQTREYILSLLSLATQSSLKLFD